MHMLHLPLLALPLATLVTATFPVIGSSNSYYRYPCGKATIKGGLVADPSKCKAGTEVTCPLSPLQSSHHKRTGSIGSIASLFLPQDMSCDKAEDGNYYCGISGCGCNSDSECDGGHCNNGKCSGGMGDQCSSDSQCSGWLKCGSGTCGGHQSSCWNYPSWWLGGDSSCLCKSGFCGKEGMCKPTPGKEGDVCDGSDECCGTGLTCTKNGNSKKCVRPPTPGPSQKAVAPKKRNVVCPASKTACPLSNGRLGYECVDTESNLEQCGGCVSEGGIDCSALPGVDSVSCISGICQIHECADDHTYHFHKRACVPTQFTLGN
ncbi:hypothetical protein JCM5296_003713 [Sporobolomyces johnsonii]